MRLDWNDIKASAAKFTAEWNDARYERSETQTFYNEFFELFGVTRRRVACLKDHELPRYILLSDFQNFELYDLDIAPDQPLRFRLQDLPDHV
jgi:hypothetical protein